jgi:chromosome partitioning protein
MTEGRKAGILALVNAKGGVGKTSAAVNIAAGLVERRRRVLLVDLDAQGSASLSVGLKRAELEPGTAAVLLDGRPIRQAIRRTYIERLDILPGSLALASADLNLADVAGREAVLRAALAPIRGEYDLVIVDCPPSLGLLTVNALKAADAYLVPVPPEYLALEGLVNLTEAVERIRAGMGQVAALLGIVLSAVDRRLRVTGELVELIRGHYGDQVCKVEVPVNVKIKEAPSFGRTVLDYAPGSAGAAAYRELVGEVLHRMRLKAIIT